MSDDDTPRFTTYRRSVSSNDEYNWGGSDGEAWGDAIDTQQNVKIEDGAVKADSGVRSSEADSKLLHRWVLDDIASGTAADAVGNADGTVNGVTANDGNWTGDSSGESDGNDRYISTSTLGNFGTSVTGSFAVAFTMQSSSDNVHFLFGSNADSNGNDTRVVMPNSFFGDPDDQGRPSLLLSDDNDQGNQVGPSTTGWFDGQPYRFVFNIPNGLDATTWTVWVNQTQVSVTVNRNNAADNFSDFINDWYLFAENDKGAVNNPYPGVLDDVCLYDDSLTDSEIQSYTNPWG